MQSGDSLNDRLLRFSSTTPPKIETSPSKVSEEYCFLSQTKSRKPPMLVWEFGISGPHVWVITTSLRQPRMSTRHLINTGFKGRGQATPGYQIREMYAKEMRIASISVHVCACCLAVYIFICMCGGQVWGKFVLAEVVTTSRLPPSPSYHIS